ncbi:MAG: LysR family transcriptional regulator [Janthinobacterium lividum]|uniref:LysR family transcriptional regulator n=1 Tax=Pseudomonas TaxID=286 RepID=UPI001CFC2718|nr:MULTISPECIES: LysR family transcriptional regulator [Pseudomonas]
MDKLNGITVFVQVAESRSFVATGRALGVSASAVGKSIARMELKLGARLFHRNTRSINLTAEGAMFLERCRRILNELEAAEQELFMTSESPKGRLRVSMPQVGNVMFVQLARFMERFPEIQLDLEFTDRLVDVIEEGFDAVIRTGVLNDSRLMARRLGDFAFHIIGAPAYFERFGVPSSLDQLSEHHCLHYKLAFSGKLERWPFRDVAASVEAKIPVTMVCNNIEMLIHAARMGQGLACVPEFSVRKDLEEGRLRSIMAPQLDRALQMQVVWPSSRFLTPKLRAFIDFICEEGL